MDGFINLETGTVHVNEVFLEKNMNYEHLMKNKFSFVRAFDMKTGWIYRVSKPYLLYGREVCLSLGFFNNILKKLSFSFVNTKENINISEMTSEFLSEKYRIQNDILLQEIGDPDVCDEKKTIYYFKWGELSSVIDVKGWSSSVILSWKE